jgi:hypothetical protein
MFLGFLFVRGKKKKKTELIRLQENPKYTSHRHIRATSYMRLRARDHCTSGNLIGGKGGASHTTLEGPKEHVKCKMDVKFA